MRRSERLNKNDPEFSNYEILKNPVNDLKKKKTKKSKEKRQVVSGITRSGKSFSPYDCSKEDKQARISETVRSTVTFVIDNVISIIENEAETNPRNISDEWAYSLIKQVNGKMIKQSPFPAIFEDDFVTFEFKTDDGLVPIEIHENLCNGLKAESPDPMICETEFYVFQSQFQNVERLITHFDRYRGEEANIGDADKYNILEVDMKETKRFYRKKINNMEFNSWYRRCNIAKSGGSSSASEELSSEHILELKRLMANDWVWSNEQRNQSGDITNPNSINDLNNCQIPSVVPIKRKKRKRKELKTD